MRLLRLVPLLLVLLAIAGTGPQASAQSLEQKLEMVKEFKRFFRKFTEPAQRVEAVLSLERADCPDAVEVLLPIIDHKEPDVARAARYVISNFREPATFARMLEELPEMKDRDKRALLFGILADAKQQKLRGVMQIIWDDDKRLNFQERYQMARAFTHVGIGEQKDILLALLDDKSWEIQVAALDSIKANNFKEAGKAVVPKLQDKTWQVRAAAIDCLSILREIDAVSPLIEMLKTEDRLKVDVAEALFRITTRDFALNYEMWRRNWDMMMGMKNFRLPTDKEVEEAEKKRKEYAAMYKDQPGGKSFAKIPTHSTRVVFIIDVSASMNDMVVDRDKFPGHDSFKKLDIVKQELINTINSLDGNTWFNIISFATKVDSWKKWLTPGNVLNKASAISYVKRLKPMGIAGPGGFGGGADGSGKTNTHAALMRAFDFDPAKDVVITGKNNKKTLQLDTIYFLTDGRPSIGKFVDSEDILQAVREVNEVRKIVIHCISIGEFEAAFLKRLASENGGVFVNLGG
jgi:HEAT repeat protein